MREEECRLLLPGRLKFVALHFPFDAHEKIEMHAFGFEPPFEGFAGVGAKFDEHFSFEHVDEDALGASRGAGLHALRESFSALAREASECVLREVPWHRNSWENLERKYFTQSNSSARARAAEWFE
jgi:hypothetical protein